MKKTALACLALLVLLIVELVVWDEVSRHSFAPAGKDASVVTVFGRVQKPGQLPYREGLTVRQFIEDRGGFSTFANIKLTRILGPSSPLDQLRGSLHNILLEADEWLEDHQWHFRVGNLRPAYLYPRANARLIGLDEPLRGGDVLIVPELLVNF